MAGMTLLAADQLDWYVGKPWAMIIDVRNRREYEKGHVKGAVNLPYDHLLERVCLPRDKILVICCERGAASMAEGKRLGERIRGQNGHRRNACIPRTISGGGRRAVRGRQSNISSCQAGKDTVR
jgi:thiosulfate sulfurtransferase